MKLAKHVIRGENGLPQRDTSPRITSPRGSRFSRTLACFARFTFPEKNKSPHSLKEMIRKAICKKFVFPCTDSPGRKKPKQVSERRHCLHEDSFICFSTGEGGLPSEKGEDAHRLCVNFGFWYNCTEGVPNGDGTPR